MKKILDKLIYVDKYEDIDKNMSESNIGAKKKKKHTRPPFNYPWDHKFSSERK